MQTPLGIAPPDRLNVQKPLGIAPPDRLNVQKLFGIAPTDHSNSFVFRGTPTKNIRTPEK